MIETKFLRHILTHCQLSISEVNALVDAIKLIETIQAEELSNRPFAEMPIGEIDDDIMSPAVKHILIRSHVKTVGGLARVTRQELQNFPQMQKRYFKEIEAFMEANGLTFWQEAVATVELPTLEYEKNLPENPADLMIYQCDVSPRLMNTLMKAGFEQLGELQSLTVSEVKQIKKLGKRTFEELQKCMEQYGIHFRSEQETDLPEEGEVNNVATK